MNDFVKIIAHRANLEGPSDYENCPNAIEECFRLGFDVEVDIRISDSSEQFFLGHDAPKFKFDNELVTLAKSNGCKIFAHCKTVSTYIAASAKNWDFRYIIPFFHQDDDICCFGDYIWVHPRYHRNNLKLFRSDIAMDRGNRKIILLTNENKIYSYAHEDIEVFDKCDAICTDYPIELRTFLANR